MNGKDLLQLLPPYNAKIVLIDANQDVQDIIKEILDAHNRYAPDYEFIADQFDRQYIDDVCEGLYKFCRNNFKYYKEPEKTQTTKSPAAFLTIGKGDCKNYAGFIGGVLSAIERQTGEKIDWYYRFASYNIFDKTPQHVFVVVKVDGEEIWIDPCLKTFNERLEPVWQPIDKKPAMALYTISGVDDHENIIGWSVETSYGYKEQGPRIVPVVKGDFLGLSRYGSWRGNTDMPTLRNELQALINKGPAPYTLDEWYVHKMMRDNVQGWNFFYERGTTPYELNWSSMVMPVRLIYNGGRWTFETDDEPPHDHPGIHNLVAHAQWLVNNYSSNPYIVVMDHLKRLGKGWNTPREGNILNPISSGEAFWKNVKQTTTEVFDSVKRVVLKVAAAVPRNAFLGIVALNGFGLASKMASKMATAAGMETIKDKWEKLGGRWKTLQNTIESGAKKPKILAGTMGEPVTLAAAVAAAAPIIAMFLKILDKDGDTTAALSAVKGTLQNLYPDLNLSGLDFLDKNTGKPIDWNYQDNTPSDNDGTYQILQPGQKPDPGKTDNLNSMPSWLLPAGLALGAGVLLLGKKGSRSRVTGTSKKKENETLLLIIGGGALTFWFLQRKKNPAVVPPAVVVDPEKGKGATVITETEIILPAPSKELIKDPSLNDPQPEKVFNDGRTADQITKDSLTKDTYPITEPKDSMFPQTSVFPKQPQIFTKQNIDTYMQTDGGVKQAYLPEDTGTLQYHPDFLPQSTM